MIDMKSTLSSARQLEMVMTGGAVILLLVLLGFVLASVADALAVGARLVTLGGYDATGLQLWQSWAIIAIVCTHLSLWGAVFWTGRTLFGRLAHGAPTAASKAAMHVAWLLWGILIWGLISQALLSVSATWHYPDGMRSLSISLGTSQLSTALAALIASFMARAFSLGAELWQDHVEIV